MLDDRKVTFAILLLIIFVVCVVAIIYGNKTHDNYADGNIDSQNKYNEKAKERGRELDEDENLENWTGRWMPSRTGEYTPPPKIFHKKDESIEEFQNDKIDEDSLKNWKGKWMPSRPGEYTPPPKIFHKKNEATKPSKNEIKDDPLENWKGRWMPSRPGEYAPPPKIFHQKNETVENDELDEDSLKNWKGRWMPSRPGEYAPPPKIFHQKNTSEQIFLPNNQIRYINIQKTYICDDGVNNLEVDWKNSSTSFACFGRKIIPDSSITPEYYCEMIPKNYKAMHSCMSGIIEYTEDIPTFGTSRPVWPAYGEYKYLPVQRWLHSLENGAIVMLYHPCANPIEVERLKRLVKRCLKRHVITPNNFLDETRPLALLSWGCKLSMSYVNASLVKQFISDNALRGPEERFEDGNYVAQLIEKAKLVSGDEDRNLCPEIGKLNSIDS